MVLENVKEMWTETPKLASGKKGRPVNKDRFISKMWVIKSLSEETQEVGGVGAPPPPRATGNSEG